MTHVPLGINNLRIYGESFQLLVEIGVNIPIITIQKKITWYKASPFLINLKNIIFEDRETGFVALGQ
jgi:hypothetical protein